MSLSAPHFSLGDCIGKGNEHVVYSSEDQDLVLKLRGLLGPFWQDMTAEAAARDLEVLQEVDFPVVPTVVHPEATVEHSLFDEEDVDYLLEQPFIDFADEDLIDFLKLRDDSSLRNLVLELFLKRHEIFKKTGMGVDLMGGKAYQDLFSVLKRSALLNKRFLASLIRRGALSVLNPVIYNVVPLNGDYLLMDTRLFRDSEAFVDPFRRAIASALIMPTHHTTTGALGTALRAAGATVASSTMDFEDEWGFQLGVWSAERMIEAFPSH